MIITNISTNKKKGVKQVLFIKYSVSFNLCKSLKKNNNKEA